MGNIQIGTANSYINLNATYASEFKENYFRTDLRAFGGLFTYREDGDFKSFKLPCVFQNSSEVSLVNSWHKSGTNLRLIPDSDNQNSYHDVRIVDKKSPFRKFENPYFNVLFRGTLVLEEY